MVGVMGGRGCVMGAEAGIYKRTPPPLTAEVAARISVHHVIDLWCIERVVLWTTTIEFVVTQLKYEKIHA